MMDDLVNHPPHYEKHAIHLEPIDLCEQLGFNVGNAVKYIIRMDDKGNRLQDMKKAAWYVDREHSRLGDDKVLYVPNTSLAAMVLFGEGAPLLKRFAELIDGHAITKQTLEYFLTRLNTEIKDAEQQEAEKKKDKNSHKPRT